MADRDPKTVPRLLAPFTLDYTVTGSLPVRSDYAQLSDATVTYMETRLKELYGNNAAVGLDSVEMEIFFVRSTYSVEYQAMILFDRELSIPALSGLNTAVRGFFTDPTVELYVGTLGGLPSGNPFSTTTGVSVPGLTNIVADSPVDSEHGTKMDESTSRQDSPLPTSRSKTLVASMVSLVVGVVALTGILGYVYWQRKKAQDGLPDLTLPSLVSSRAPASAFSSIREKLSMKLNLKRGVLPVLGGDGTFSESGGYSEAEEDEQQNASSIKLACFLEGADNGQSTSTASSPRSVSSSSGSVSSASGRSRRSGRYGRR